MQKSCKRSARVGAYISGQAVQFPLLVQIDHDKDLESSAIGDEDFIKAVHDFKPSGDAEKAERNKGLVDGLLRKGDKPASRPSQPSEGEPAPPFAGGRRKLADIEFNPGDRSRKK